MSRKPQQPLFVDGVSGLAEGLHGAVLTKISNRQILTSLAHGNYPQQKSHFDIEVKWYGAKKIQTLAVVVEAAARPLNTGGYYWVLIMRVETDAVLERLAVIGGPRPLLNRHLIIVPANSGLHAWLIPDQFSLHNRLIRDMTFSQDSDDDHRLILTQLEYLAAAFKHI